MKRALFFLLCTLCGSSLFSQDLTGKWTGLLRQNINGVFALEMNITQATGNSYTGSISSTAVSGPFRGKMTGRVTLTSLGNGKVDYKDMGILDSTGEKAYYWCLKKAVLDFAATADSLVINGNWAAVKSDCPPGTMYLARDLPRPPVAITPPQKIDPGLVAAKEPINTTRVTEAVVKVRGVQLKIEVWDFDALDNDSVSLTLNGKQVGPKDILLPAYKKYGSPEFTYPVELVKGDNVLEILAKNEGLRPHNTVGVIVTDDSGSQRFFFKLKAKETSTIHFLRM